MKKYKQLLREVLYGGEYREDRTGTGTVSQFGKQTKYDLRAGFPLVTTKRVYWAGVVHELLWFLKGSTNTEYLTNNNVKIWDEWASTEGDLGPVYGKQWRAWNSYKELDGRTANRQDLLNSGFHAATYLQNDKDYKVEVSTKTEIDQIAEVVQRIKDNPKDRRLIVSAWNPADLPEMALPPCHMMFQFYCHSDGGLSLQLYQRSADLFLGVPFNIASYALLLEMVAQVTGRYAKEFIHVLGDAHIYSNHTEQVNLQLSREPRDLPKLKLNPDIMNIDEFKFEDIELLDYSPHAGIKGKVSV